MGGTAFGSMKWMEPLCSAVAYSIRAALYSVGNPRARKVSACRACLEHREEKEVAVWAAGEGVELLRSMPWTRTRFGAGRHAE